MLPIPAIIRLWVSRLFWFVVVVVGMVMLLHLPAGFRAVKTGERTVGVRTVTTYRFVFDTGRYAAELRRFPADLKAGAIQYIENPAAKGYPFLPLLRRDWINSFKLFAAGVGAGSLLGVLLGMLVALRGRLLRALSISLSVFSLSLPDFFVVLLLQFISIWAWLRYDVKPFLVLADPFTLKGWLIPLITMTLMPMGYTARLTAGAMDEVMREEYIRTARSKGLHEGRVIFGHAFRNAMPRVLTGLPALLNVTLSSLPVVERLTNWPGISKWLVVQSVYIDDRIWGISPAIASSAIILLIAWFMLFDGLAHTIRLIFSPKAPEVARA